MTRSQLHRARKDAQAKLRVCTHTLREAREAAADASTAWDRAAYAADKAKEALDNHDTNTPEPTTPEKG